MRKFVFRLSREFTLESKASLLIKDIDMSRLVRYMQ